MREVFTKHITLLDEELDATVPACLRLHDDPTALRSGIDAVDLHRGSTDRHRNALQMSNPTEMIRENCEVKILTCAIESDLSQVHGVLSFLARHHATAV